jgi:hypothetical protein
LIVDLFAKYSDAIEAKDNLKLKFDVLFNTRVTFLSDKQLEGYFLLLQDNKLLEELEIGNVKNVLHINYVALSIPVSVLNVNDLELTDYAARVRKAKEFIVYNFSMKLRMVMADFGVDKIRNTVEKIAWLQKMSKEVMSFAVKVVPAHRFFHLCAVWRLDFSIYPPNGAMMLKSLSIVEIKEIPKTWTAEDIIFLCNLRNGQNQAAVQ